MYIPGAQGGQEVSDLLEVKLWIIVSYHVGTVTVMIQGEMDLGGLGSNHSG